MGAGSPPAGTHPAGHQKHRQPGPQKGHRSPGQANGPVGAKDPKDPKDGPVSPLLGVPPIAITAAILGEFVSVTGVDAVTVAQNLNTTVKLANITTALAEAMLIAQTVVESGGFTKSLVVEDHVESPVVFSTSKDVPDKFKQPFMSKHDRQRYLHGRQVALWRRSKIIYDKARSTFASKNPKGNFDASGEWENKDITDYIPGDAELPYWKLLYDPESPLPRRAEMAKKYGNMTPGDGLKYIGRGYFQLTWQCNYAEAGKTIKMDLVATPALAADPQVSMKVAAWYWIKHRCNAKASADTDSAFTSVCHAINGGNKGLAERKAAYAKIKAALIKQLAPATPAPAK